MSLFKQLLGFQSLTLAASVESFLAIRLLPSHADSSRSHLATASAIFAANYAIWAIFWLLFYPHFLNPLRKLAGPKSIFRPTQRALLQTERPPGDIFIEIAQEYPGEDMLFLNTTQNQVLVTSPRYLADLLVHRAYDFVKPRKIAAFLRNVLGDGLVVLEGAQHKFMRKNTMPAFSFRHIKDLYPMMWAKATLLTRALLVEEEFKSDEGEKKGTSAVVELSTWASRITLDIIGIAGLGRNFNTLEKSEDPLQKLYEELLEPSTEHLLFAALSFLFGLRVVRWLPWSMNAKFNHITSSLAGICAPMIQAKRDSIAKKGDDHFDILSLLIKSGNFSDGELTDQLLTFLAAGHETTSSSLSWACYLLAKHPEIQTSLREEVLAALPSSTLSPNAVTSSSSSSDFDLATALEQLPILNGTMNETLRLYPTVPITMREAIRDTRLGDQPIPEGTTMVLSMWLMNRSPDVWGADAAEFRPERWVDEVVVDGKSISRPNQTGGASNNYQFLTFLHGPRSCIGQAFAKAEMRCLLAALVASFEWDLAMEESKVIPRGVITIKPAHGLYLRLRPLNKQ